MNHRVLDRLDCANNSLARGDGSGTSNRNDWCGNRARSNGWRSDRRPCCRRRGHRRGGGRRHGHGCGCSRWDRRWRNCRWWRSHGCSGGRWSRCSRSNRCLRFGLGDNFGLGWRLRGCLCCCGGSSGCCCLLAPGKQRRSKHQCCTDYFSRSKFRDTHDATMSGLQALITPRQQRSPKYWAKASTATSDFIQKAATVKPPTDNYTFWRP